MEQSDEIIVKNCQKGELEQFGILYEKYVKKIYSFVYFKIQHKESAEDITVKVFIKALDKIGSFKHSEGTFQAWIYKIARNTIIDHYRTSKIEANIEDAWDLPDNNNLERDLDLKVRLEAVEKYLKKLSPEQRELIIMRVWQDMPYREIAEILGKSESACKVAYSRAIGQLRKDLPLTLFIALCLLQ
ncbi:MAG: ECF subfamily RNA polymerase sigma factor [Candidatus Falkowbacteria bacterium GW2011_GWC2_38_22]|uniref:ECF subfamily RNA polymerase sigma factor n=1 Tax=Candidatus Falkowbacteria bacterium GW2011_GWE1_38_31 TaxID=1618638 RepID=A0A0G0JT24_9BACT|nr:MAG: ECF subfamily RNA polymerase sigma factor [Candidatus Falkowbacteria bacterium GW2011_GWF2_38_1205]KKQ61640.1 MAG: ECF subfamily RNA polymerase sigma factor [Candidatus Falkowbacteria bacterium GW2011_GWC2_38_22]KKQ63745.1 MAG: ECF subfamily RNA polymerase sigma factor [Candidatus Falkowbacteria bacterium GW2011_GWF1_38_22]KKQ65839.1 MAG: ECF subfamily RNA polymerase sigma factor [Candidatus Falkowbacteria bacterium GW2011_GWE2_38_254]KKQ70608.1 MAG: ECF subfamily RNA polymerase sigma f